MPETIFTHRYDTQDDHDLIDVVDAINAASNKATATLKVFSLQFEEGAAMCSNEINENVIQAVIADIEDIKAINNAFYTASKGGAQLAPTTA